jgi:hypothetical protein
LLAERIDGICFIKEREREELNNKQPTLKLLNKSLEGNGFLMGRFLAIMTAS